MNTVLIPIRVWKDVRDFFSQIVSPCKECVRGNPVRCWYSQCAAFKYRPIARDVLAVPLHQSANSAPIIPTHVRVEQEILSALANFDCPITPATLKLRSTHSKAVKSKAISRLVKRGRIIEERIDNYIRYISLPTKKDK